MTKPISNEAIWKSRPDVSITATLDSTTDKVEWNTPKEKTAPGTRTHSSKVTQLHGRGETSFVKNNEKGSVASQAPAVRGNSGVFSNKVEDLRARLPLKEADLNKLRELLNNGVDPQKLPSDIQRLILKGNPFEPRLQSYVEGLRNGTEMKGENAGRRESIATAVEVAVDRAVINNSARLHFSDKEPKHPTAMRGKAAATTGTKNGSVGIK